MDFLFANGAIWFTVPALAGTLFLVLQLVVGELGGDLDADLDVDVSSDTGGAEFRALSLQSLSAFALGGGWMGLAALKVLHWDFTWAALLGVAAGVGVAWVMVWLLRTMLKVQSSGNIALTDTIGEHGTVYISVPPSGQGSGRVRVLVAKRAREYNAVQHGGETLATHTSVRVKDVDRSANAVVVEPA
ncbi:MAG: hypothetical protein DHS20C14_06610 [Phycisphaeraceae bacterium]|nr:MAG: hypothetical protein DHS20C14_06610 [Phycisphaeraceae bacterium]